jgi:methylmalonyl-CoA/ethylmalonyl-CoA epimerase
MAQTGLGHVAQIALRVSDTDLAERFYKDVLGLPMLFRFGNLVFLNCNGLRLMLEGGQESRGAGHSAFCVYFRCAELAPIVALLKGDGVYFEQEPHLVAKMPDHELWMAFFRDPDNNLLALMEERKQVVAS